MTKSNDPQVEELKAKSVLAEAAVMAQSLLAHAQEQAGISNGVLFERLKSVDDKIVANQLVNHEAHQMIIAQVEKTNGRTTKLEAAMNVMRGALIVLHVLVIPVLIVLIIDYFNKKP